MLLSSLLLHEEMTGNVIDTSAVLLSDLFLKIALASELRKFGNKLVTKKTNHFQGTLDFKGYHLVFSTLDNSSRKDIDKRRKSIRQFSYSKLFCFVNCEYKKHLVMTIHFKNLLEK